MPPTMTNRECIPRFRFGWETLTSIIAYTGDAYKLNRPRIYGRV
jgi:hypothetical protein